MTYPFYPRPSESSYEPATFTSATQQNFYNLEGSDTSSGGVYVPREHQDGISSRATSSSSSSGLFVSSYSNHVAKKKMKASQKQRGGEQEGVALTLPADENEKHNTQFEAAKGEAANESVKFWLEMQSKMYAASKHLSAASSPSNAWRLVRDPSVVLKPPSELRVASFQPQSSAFPATGPRLSSVTPKGDAISSGTPSSYVFSPPLPGPSTDDRPARSAQSALASWGSFGARAQHDDASRNAAWSSRRQAEATAHGDRPQRRIEETFIRTRRGGQVGSRRKVAKEVRTIVG